MLKKIASTLVISLASISLIGTGAISGTVVANAASNNSAVQVLSTGGDLQSVFNIISEAADIIGVDEKTVVSKIAGGSSLCEIAESNNINESTLLELLRDRAETSINEALADNTITETEAASMKTYMPVMLKLLVENKYFSSSNLLAAPQNLKAKSKNATTITLSFSAVSKATSYYIYRSTSTYGPYKKIAAVKTTSYTDKSAVKGTTYYYKIKAIGSSGTSPYSSVLKAAVGSDSSISSGSVSAPGGLTATAASDTQITIKWSSVANATYYYIYRATSSSGTYSKVASSTSSSYTDSSLSTDTTYYYKVIALNSSNQSGYSAIVSATTEASGSDLDAPDNLTAEAEGDDEIILEWDSVEDADGYYIYRATSSSGTYSKIDTVDDTEYTDEDVDADTTYYYKIKAYNDDETSDYSSVVYDTTDDEDSDSDLDEPDDLDITDVTEDSITLEWDSVEDAEAYYIYRSTSKSGTYTKIDYTYDTEYTDYDVDGDTTYYYKVKAYNDDETSDYSAIVYDTTDDDDSDSDLDAPDDLTAEAESDDEILLEWDSVEDADGYYIYRATSSSGSYSKIDSVDDTEYTDDGLTADKTYYYKVKAYNDDDTSDYSSVAHATTDED